MLLWGCRYGTTGKAPTGKFNPRIHDKIHVDIIRYYRPVIPGQESRNTRNPMACRLELA